MPGALARELCTLSLRTRYRGRVTFTVCSVRRLYFQRIYLLASRDVMGARSVSFTARRGAGTSELISAAAFLACCLAGGEERADQRVLAEVGAAAPLGATAGGSWRPSGEAPSGASA